MTTRSVLLPRPHGTDRTGRELRHVRELATVLHTQLDELADDIEWKARIAAEPHTGSTGQVPVSGGTNSDRTGTLAASAYRQLVDHKVTGATRDLAWLVWRKLPEIRDRLDAVPTARTGGPPLTGTAPTGPLRRLAHAHVDAISTAIDHAEDHDTRRRAVKDLVWLVDRKLPEIQARLELDDDRPLASDAEQRDAYLTGGVSAYRGDHHAPPGRPDLQDALDAQHRRRRRGQEYGDG